MDYFEFYGLPVSFHLDEAELKRRFLLFSKNYHPDHFTLETEEIQAEMLEKAALNNQAYRTLADFDKRMAYILELNNALSVEGKNEIPQAFLMEMMEINEGLMELEFGPDATLLALTSNKLASLEADLNAAIAPEIRLFDSGDRAPEMLAKVKEFYGKKRYLWRIQENLNKFAPASKEA